MSMSCRVPIFFGVFIPTWRKSCHVTAEFGTKPAAHHWLHQKVYVNLGGSGGRMVWVWVVWRKTVAVTWNFYAVLHRVHQRVWVWCRTLTWIFGGGGLNCRQVKNPARIFLDSPRDEIGIWTSNSNLNSDSAYRWFFSCTLHGRVSSLTLGLHPCRVLLEVRLGLCKLA